MSKISLVIGGTGGLGRDCAEDLAKDHTVIVAGRNQTKGDEVVKAIKDRGGEACFFAIDMTDPASISSAHKQVLEKYGRLDVAVNAAGIISSFLRLADTNPEEFNNVMTINVTGVYLSMQEQIKAMLANTGDRKGGRIVNYTSIYGLRACKWGAIYCKSSLGRSKRALRLTLSREATSKHALVGLTRSAALEYAKNDILINAVAPGELKR